MKKKIAARKFISLGILTFGIGAVGVPAIFSSTAIAAEPVITQEDLNIKKAELERAQAEYDEALEKQQTARDVVVNAERALEDAQANYDEVMAKYRTGFAGFLQWVIDTETDPAKVEDAKQQLLSFMESDDIDPDAEKLFNPYNVKYMEIYEVQPGDVTNITRLYYVADWLDTLAQYYDNTDINVSTSHQYMAATMGLMYQAVKDSWRQEVEKDSLYIYDKPGEIDHGPVGGDRDYTLSYYYNIGSYSFEEDDEIPVIPKLNSYPQELFDSRIAANGDGFLDRYDTQNVLLGISCGSYANGANFVNWGLWEADDIYNKYGYHVNDKREGTYSLREYAQAIRDYYALVNPEPFQLAFNQADNDMDEAQRNLNSADSLLSSKLARLKDVQRDYDEAVALFMQQDLLSPDSSEISEPISSAPQLQFMETQEAPDTEAEALTAFTAAETVSHNELESTENTETIVQLHKPQSEEISFTEKEVETADTGAVEASQDVQKNARNEQGILAEVLTYIFNGGAIAFIIPSGFIRRKSYKEIPV